MEIFLNTCSFKSSIKGFRVPLFHFLTHFAHITFYKLHFFCWHDLLQASSNSSHIHNPFKYWFLLYFPLVKTMVKDLDKMLFGRDLGWPRVLVM